MDEIAMTAGDLWAAKRGYEQFADEASSEGNWEVAVKWAKHADRMHAAYRMAVERERAAEAA